MYSSYYGSRIIPTTTSYMSPMSTSYISGAPLGTICTNPCLSPYGTTTIYESAPVMMGAPIGATYGSIYGVSPMTTEVIEETITTYPSSNTWLW
jgi:hypothetical protein